MNLSEKSAYLKGLMDGLKLDQEAPEGKMISGIVELLQEVTGAIGDLQENAEAVSDELDEIEDDLDAIEDYLMDDDDEEDGFMDDDGEDFYRVALRIAGRNACVRTKLEYGYPLNGEDISFLKSLL